MQGFPDDQVETTKVTQTGMKGGGAPAPQDPILALRSPHRLARPLQKTPWSHRPLESPVHLCYLRRRFSRALLVGHPWPPRMGHVDVDPEVPARSLSGAQGTGRAQQGWV